MLAYFPQRYVMSVFIVSPCLSVCPYVCHLIVYVDLAAWNKLTVLYYTELKRSNSRRSFRRETSSSAMAERPRCGYVG